MSSLHQKLQTAKTEEDVKDIYIKALGLKDYSKNLIDIQTKEIWFEAKDKGTISTYAMFRQPQFVGLQDAATSLEPTEAGHGFSFQWPPHSILLSSEGRQAKRY